MKDVFWVSHWIAFKSTTRYRASYAFRTESDAGLWGRWGTLETVLKVIQIFAKVSIHELAAAFVVVFAVLEIAFSSKGIDVSTMPAS